jgi:2'-5' RNA ligase
VIVPPRAVLDAIALAVQSVDGVAVAAPSPSAKGGFLRRRANPAVPAAQPSEPAGEELELIPSERMLLPIAGFGNVTREDAVKLADVLRAAANTWDRPTVRLAGGGALEFPDDRSVWAKLDGDIDALLTIANGVAQRVESRGFFVDRRAFRPWLAVATITKSTTAPHLENVVAALDAFEGEAWTIEWISLVKPFFEESVPVSKELYRIELGPA